MNFATRSQWLFQWALVIVYAFHTQFATSCQHQGGPCSQQHMLPPLSRAAPPPQPMPPPPPPAPMPPPPMPMPPPPMPFAPGMAMAQGMMAVPSGYAMIIPGFDRRRHTTTTTSTSTTTPRPPRPFIIPIQMIPAPMMPPPMMPPPMMSPPMMPAPMMPPPMLPGPPMMPGPSMMIPGSPMMIPSPMMFLNYPSNRRQRNWLTRRPSGSSSTSSSSSSSRECNSCSAPNYMKTRWNTVTRHNMLRAHKRVPEVGVVKPVLSYVGPHGDVKFETKITNKEAVSLLNDKDASIDFENDSLNHHEESKKNVRVLRKQDGDNEQLVVYTEDEPGRAGRFLGRRSFQRVEMGKPMQQFLHKGKKELIFNAPENKRITNMTLSFQVV